MGGGSRGRALTLGLALWVVPAAVAGLLGDGPGLVRWLLLLAVVVLVPVGAPLVGASRRVVVALQLCGVPVVVAVLLPSGPVAGAAALPWLVLAVMLTAAAARRWVTAPAGRRLAELPVLAAAGYLTVGAGWLLAERLGLAPLGFEEPFTALTAVHFHHAGAVATTVTAVTAGRSASRLARLAAWLVMLAPPVVGAGFLGLRPLLLVGACMLTVGLWAWAAAVLRPVRSWSPGRAVRVAAAAVLVPMALAVQWAAGAVLGTPALSVPVMAATHGVLNGIGFGLFAVVGLTRPPRVTSPAAVRWTG